MKTEAKKMGRPKKAPRPGSRVALGLSVTAATKRKLDAAADREKRSQSQEAERRLEASFRDELLLEHVHDRLYGRRVSGLFMQIGLLAREVAFATRPPGTPLGETDHLLSSPFPFDQFAKAISEALELHRPAGDPAPTAQDLPALPTGAGAEWDAKLIQAAQHYGEDIAIRLDKDLRDPVKRRSPTLAPITERLGLADLVTKEPRSPTKENTK